MCAKVQLNIFRTKVCADNVFPSASIKSKWLLRAIVIDGLQKLFEVFADYKIQMCQFHMVAIIRRKLTKSPKLMAGRELLELLSE